MIKAIAFIRLCFNFLKDVIASGWATTLIILFRSGSLRPGYVKMPYGDLPDNAANFLGALITLTPGTTMIDIDIERREFLLHLLDMEQAEATLAAIRRDFLEPTDILFEGRT